MRLVTYILLFIAIVSNAQVYQNINGTTVLAGSSITGTVLTNGFTPAAYLSGGLTTPSVTVTGSVPGTVLLNDANGGLRALLGTNDNFMFSNAVTSKTIKGTNGTVTAFAFVGDGSGLTGLPASGVPTTITQTNFVLNTVYTNTTQAAILKASVALTTASVNGQASINLMVDQAGGTTFLAISTNGIVTTIAVSLAATDTRSMVGIIAASSTYYWTNTSSGSGNSAAIVAGTGQICTISSGTNGATGATGPAGTNIVNSGVVALTDAATIATDATLGMSFRVTLGGNRTLGNPTGALNGQKFLWELIQDGTGGRTLTLDTKFGLGDGINAVTLSTTAGKRDFLTAVYNSTSDKFYVVGFTGGY